MFAWLKKKNTPPNAAAVMARVIILKYLFVRALAMPPPEYHAECKERWTKNELNEFLIEEQKRTAQLIERLRQNGLWNAMGHEERNFMEMRPTEVAQKMLIDASWSIESIVCLLWALGLISELPPYDQQADPEARLFAK
jgi:hypothetical protein